MNCPQILKSAYRFVAEANPYYADELRVLEQMADYKEPFITDNNDEITIIDVSPNGTSMLVEYEINGKPKKEKLSKVLPKILPLNHTPSTKILSSVYEFVSAALRYEQGLMSYAIYKGDDISAYYAETNEDDPVSACMAGNPYRCIEFYDINDNVRLVAIDYSSKMFLFRDVNGVWVADRCYADQSLRHLAQYLWDTEKPLVCEETGDKYKISDVIISNRYNSSYHCHHMIKMKYIDTRMPYLDNFRFVVDNDIDNGYIYLVTENDVDLDMNAKTQHTDVCHVQTYRRWADKFIVDDGGSVKVLSDAQLSRSIIVRIRRIIEQAYKAGLMLFVDRRGVMKIGMPTTPNNVFKYRSKEYPYCDYRLNNINIERTNYEPL